MNRLQPFIIVFCIFVFTVLDECPAESNQNVTSAGHTVHVLAVAYSRDGKYIVSGGGDNTVRIWDRETGKHLRLLKGGILGRTESVAVSPDGQYIVSTAFFDRKIRIWNFKTGSLVRAFSGHSFFGVWSATFSPDGNQIVSGGADGTVRLWDLETGKQTAILEYHSPGFLSDVLSVAFSPDGKYIASASFDMTICLWERATGKKLRVLKGHTAEVCSVVFNPGGEYIASGSSDETVRLWKVKTGMVVNIFHGHSGIVNSVDFSPDGRHIVSASNDKTLRLWNVYTKKEERIYRGHHDIVYSVAFSPDGKQIVSGGRDKKIILWNMETGGILRVLERQAPKPKISGASYFWAGIFFIVLLLVFLAAASLKKDVRSEQLRAFSEEAPHITSLRQALRIEDGNPRKALRMYEQLIGENCEWHWNIVLLVIAMPVIGFITANVVGNYLDIPAWATTIFIWLPIGYYPHYSATRELGYALSGREDPLKGIQRYAVAPLVNFFLGSIMLFIVVITTFILTIVLCSAIAIAYHLAIKLPFSQASQLVQDYLGLPMMAVIFVIVSLVLNSYPTRIMSPRRLFLAIRLSAKGIFKFYIKALVALVLTVGVTGFFHQNPVYGIILSLFVGILGGLGNARSERYYVPEYLFHLARMRCLIRLGNSLEAEQQLQALFYISEKDSTLWLIRTLSASLFSFITKNGELKLIQEWIDNDRMRAEREYGSIGRATIFNTESILFKDQVEVDKPSLTNEMPNKRINSDKKS